MAKLRKDGKPDGRSKNGGVRKGAGRKAKGEELKLAEKLYELEQDALEALHNGLKRGDYRFVQLFMNYYYGKPTDNIKLEGGDKPVQIKLTDLVAFTQPNNPKKLND